MVKSQLPESDFRLLGLLLFFPFGYWFLPWFLRTTSARMRSLFLRRLLYLFVCAPVAITWNIFLLILFVGYVLIQGFASGELGQGMMEQSSVTDCLRMVRDKELRSTLECSNKATSLLKMDDEDYLKPLDVASRTCLLSIQSASSAKINNPGSESLISDLSEQAKADCSHPAVNDDAVESAFFSHLIDDPLAYEILSADKTKAAQMK